MPSEPVAEFSVATGVRVSAALDRQMMGLLLAEAHQELGDLQAATAVVEERQPTTLAAVSLAELYAVQSRWQDVVDLTNGVTNEDEPPPTC